MKRLTHWFIMLAVCCAGLAIWQRVPNRPGPPVDADFIVQTLRWPDYYATRDDPHYRALSNYFWFVAWECPPHRISEADGMDGCWAEHAIRHADFWDKYERENTTR